MKTGHIKSNTFRAALYRIDPSFHLSEGIKVRRMLDNVPYGLTTVGDTSDKVFIGNIFSRVFVKDAAHGVPYLAASDTVLSNLDTGRFLSKKQASDLSYLILKKNWILATCSGTLGNVTYTNEEFDGRIATHDLIRIVPNDKNILRGCLYAFLASKYGYYQLTESQFGGVVKHINAEHAKNINIPLFPRDIQQKVDSLIKESARLREEAASKLRAAHERIDNYFNNNYNQNKNLIVGYKDVISSQLHRFDASYHISKGKYYDDYIKSNFQWKHLGEVARNISRPDIFKRMYVKEGIKFLSGSDILLRIPDSDKQLSIKTPHKEEFIVNEGWILLPRSGTIGDVVYTTSQHVGD